MIEILTDIQWFAICIAALSIGMSKTGVQGIMLMIVPLMAMAFGDGGNDITMLRHVGTGVAMGNALDEVKAAADIVTTSVDEDGIANIIEKL